MDFESLLLSVEKPSRYIGGEPNAVFKSREDCRLSFALAFPDTYEVGMSHLGLQILYAVLNGMPGVAAERCFAPWPDMEARMRQAGMALASLESHTPLHRFDIVGFSFQYELSYTNVLNMLELARIPLRRKDRRRGDPLVIAGGPCVFNPAPMAPFMDAFVIGEGEDVVQEIAQTVMAAKTKGYTQMQTLEALARLEGVYVPAIHTGREVIRKRIITDFNRRLLPTSPVVPLMKTIHDRITLEIARGCTRGCRFCQAGMVWRPVREKEPAGLIALADCSLAATGHDEISLLSLSSGDYTFIEPLLSLLMDRYYADRIALALPSLRVETLTPKLMADIKRVRKTSFTLAPEAGTQRLRNVINKGNTEEELLRTVGGVFDAGWKAVKLYFMIGLPGETATDLEGICDLAHKTLRLGKNLGKVTVSLSTFVPKPHTPFQWSRQISMDETREKQDFFRQAIRHRNLSVKWHDHLMSFLEGLLSRGDETMAEVIEEAFRRGARFDGWSDQFCFPHWEAALETRRIRPEKVLAALEPSALLPWDRIATGLSRKFLLQEAEKANREELTPDCRRSPCHLCGVCDHERIKTVLATDPDAALSGVQETGVAGDPSRKQEQRFRIQFTKKGRARLLSHLEVSTALTRAVRQEGLRFIYSQGFHPHPRISFAVATSVGMESLAEYVDMRVESPTRDMNLFIEAANRALPSGMAILACRPLSHDAPSLSDAILGFRYRLALGGPEGTPSDEEIREALRAFLEAPSFTATKVTHNKTVTRDIRPFVDALSYEPQDRILCLQVRRLDNGTLSPTDFLRDVLNMEGQALIETRITKTDTCFRTP